MTKWKQAMEHADKENAMKRLAFGTVFVLTAVCLVLFAMIVRHPPETWYTANDCPYGAVPALKLVGKPTKYTCMTEREQQNMFELWYNDRTEESVTESPAEHVKHGDNSPACKLTLDHEDLMDQAWVGRP